MKAVETAFVPNAATMLASHTFLANCDIFAPFALPPSEAAVGLALLRAKMMSAVLHRHHDQSLAEDWSRSLVASLPIDLDADEGRAPWPFGGPEPRRESVIARALAAFPLEWADVKKEILANNAWKDLFRQQADQWSVNNSLTKKLLDGVCCHPAYPLRMNVLLRATDAWDNSDVWRAASPETVARMDTMQLLAMFLWHAPTQFLTLLGHQNHPQARTRWSFEHCISVLNPRLWCCWPTLHLTNPPVDFPSQNPLYSQLLFWCKTLMTERGGKVCVPNVGMHPGPVPFACQLPSYRSQAQATAALADAAARRQVPATELYRLMDVTAYGQDPRDFLVRNGSTTEPNKLQKLISS